MSKLLSVLIAGIFAAVSFTAVAADAAPAKDAGMTTAAPAKAESKAEEKKETKAEEKKEVKKHKKHKKAKAAAPAEAPAAK